MAAIVLAGTAEAPQSKEATPSAYSAPKVQSQQAADVSFDSALWQGALKIENFTDFNLRVAAPFATSGRLTYDDNALYVEIDAAQPGVPITAAQKMDHAGVGTDDYVAVALDTSGNGSRVYTFRVNPAGVHDETSTENARYSPRWESKATVLPKGGYRALFVIPFRILRTQSATVQDWKLNVYRSIAATNALYTWAYQTTQVNVNLPQFWPTLTGLRLDPRAARLSPYADVYGLAGVGTDRNLNQVGPGRFRQVPFRSAGIDVTYPISSSLAIVGTVAPDFSNIEQDQFSIAPQVFKRAFTEYRPFFAQGAQFINTMPYISTGVADSLFYTPSFGDFDRGIKLEGTAGPSAIGLLHVQGAGFKDTAMGYAIRRPDNKMSLRAEAVLANHSGLRDDTLGVGMFANNPHNGAFELFSLEHESNASTGSAHSFFVGEGIQSAKGYASLDYRDISSNFNPTDGYTALNGIRGPRFIYTYNGVSKKSTLLKYWSGTMIADRYVDPSGAVREADARYLISAALRNNFAFTVSAGPGYIALPGATSSAAYSLTQFSVGYADGTPSPVDIAYAYGPFGGAFLQQVVISSARPFGPYTLSAQFGDTAQHSGASPQTQWLRRLGVTRSFGRDASLSVAVRSLNGEMASSAAGTNLAVSFHQRYKNASELYIDLGSPAATSTIHRVMAKYVFHAGGPAGT